MKALAWAACAVAMGTAGVASAQDWLKVEGTRIVDEAGDPVILRGMGLGGWLLQKAICCNWAPWVSSTSSVNGSST